MNKNSKDILKIFKQVAKSYNWIYRVGKKSITLPLDEKGGNVEQPPKWFQYWSDNVFVPFVTEMQEIKADTKEFIKEQREFNKALLACPTIKKEIDPKFLDKYK